MNKHKCFTLESGVEESWSWQIVIYIKRNGVFAQKGCILYNNNKEVNKRHYPKHKEEICNRSKEYYKNNSKKHHEMVRRWRKAHPEQEKENQKKWRHNNPAYRIIDARCKSRRERELGFVPLNSPFPDSAGHHIDTEHVVFIPESIHRQFPHNLKNPDDNLEQLNQIASMYYAMERAYLK